MRQGEKLHVHPPLEIRQYLTRCALSPNSTLKLEDVDNAISEMLNEGAIGKILSNYQ